jgi:sigma-B regulation protein RsbU (phosphoserine phosphatase)
MGHDLKILFLEDNKDDYALVQHALHQSNFMFKGKLATNKDEFIDSLTSFEPDVILSDHTLPQFDSLSALKIVKDKYPHIPFILVTGSVSEEFAVKCIKTGAEDYILKDNLIKLPSIVENAIHKKELKTENRIIKSLNERLKNAYDIIAQKNKDITDSITYAKRIQKAILPDKKQFYRSLPESFILYKPKDIISGDFYWFAEHAGKSIIAVSDCTGHGVPGALLSMIGYHLLNNILFLKNISSPADILNELNAGFTEVFKTEKDEDPIHDGMDIAIYSVDKTTMTGTFSAARRPLYIVRGNDIIELKGSPLPIGGGYDERIHYTNEVVKIEKGDKFYLFTDGYADQFGGKHRKKLKITGFKELILKHHSLKMSLQKKRLNDEIEKWKNEEEQTDDILVLGFEI